MNTFNKSKLTANSIYDFIQSLILQAPFINNKNNYLYLSFKNNAKTIFIVGYIRNL
ncbi:hypothetical protein NTG1052_550060 [Candidatus Nitrotoga sp. 1052]|nr:hypothetical protein NTG1052_550060 [Candidatus Nitrotoga sp. 1052]